MTTANPSYKPSEGKREEFRKYLEKSGVMDALTKVLVNLYEEVDKPEDALEYIREKLAVIAGIDTYKQLQLKLSEAEEKLKELEAQLQSSGEVPLAPEGSIEEQMPEEAPKEEIVEKIPEKEPEVVEVNPDQ